MDAIATQIHALTQTADAAGRLALQKALRQMQAELQSPMDFLINIANSMPLLASLRLGADLGLFRTLAQRNDSLSVAQLAESTGASPQLLERLLRYYSSNNIIKEVGVNEYKATSLSHVLADPKGEATVYVGFDTHAPAFQAMPDFFADNKYQEIASTTRTPFQKAFKTDLGCFDWLVQHPKHFEPLQKVMTAFAGSEWADGFALLDNEVKAVPFTPPDPKEKPFFVDVGGGHGHQCIQLGKKYPHLLGRLVLQDLPEAVNKLPDIPGVRADAYNFFDKQPITGARFYYLRRILHDWPDDECVQILYNIASAMAVDSRILIDEVVLPNKEAPWQATMADLAMMVSFGGKERTQQQWQMLAGEVGLRIEQIHTYTASTCTSVVVMALK
ncbi:o-methyltransferase [Hirsutella rhossiliensis]|uniref:O-methyltransferase domain-containing protein n=1 Tax=Hirsutella rhossiliensis TaxID=111463 RepID=A0A9P8MXB2_9HYPO|nr:o-methyltransferase domain-containing protein [Hirsutella rhossiliensis]KAH0961976.1 o-methyltransferase domain-containing protein [Hirsutella rhossiliensis]